MTIDISIFDNRDSLVATKTFSENFEYKIQDNKFNLKQYEKNIKLNLIEDITQQMNFSNLKMISKSFEIGKKNISKFKLFVIYGENEGLKRKL